jgi:hypothetical protein
MRDLAAAVIKDHVLTVRRTDEGRYQFHQEFPGGGSQSSTRTDVVDAFTRMGEEVKRLEEGTVDEPVGGPTDPDVV